MHAKADEKKAVREEAFIAPVEKVQEGVKERREKRKRAEEMM
jgi:ribosomal RNA assembly protein